MINIETPTYYTATKKYELSFPSLETDLDADVVVIGGGFSGINTALELAEHGITDIVVLEARHLGFGGTGRNGGQIMAGIGHDLEKIRKDVGEDGLRAIFEISDLGADIIKGRIEKYAIDADFCHGYGYMGFNARQAKTLQAWEKEFRSLGSPHEIRYLHGAEVRQIIGSDAYGSALLHMGGGHVHSLNLLLGEAKALAGLGARIFEYSPALEVQYGERIRVRTAKGSVTANKLLWACDSFLNRLEPELHRTTINTYAFQMMTEPLPDELIQRISPIRGAYSDIRPVIDYYRVTNENRLLFGAATPFVERIPGDLKAWNRKLMLKIFPSPGARPHRPRLGWADGLQRQPVPADRQPLGAAQRVLRPGLFRVRRDPQPHRLQGPRRRHERRLGALRPAQLGAPHPDPRQGPLPPAAAQRGQDLAPALRLLERPALKPTEHSTRSIPMAITVIRHGITLDELDAWGSVADLGSEILEGEVKAFGKMTAGAPTDPVSAAYFGTTAGKFRMTYPFSEQATVVSGEVRLTDESTGQSTLYKAGDSWFVSKGTPVLWEVADGGFVKHYYAVA